MFYYYCHGFVSSAFAIRRHRRIQNTHIFGTIRYLAPQFIRECITHIVVKYKRNEATADDSVGIILLCVRAEKVYHVIAETDDFLGV